MLWFAWAGIMASLVLEMAGIVAAGPILDPNLTDAHQNLSRRDDSWKKRYSLFHTDHTLNNDKAWANAMQISVFDPYPIPWVRDSAPKDSSDDLSKLCQTPCRGTLVDTVKFRFYKGKVNEALNIPEEKIQDIIDRPEIKKRHFPTLCVCDKIDDGQLSELIGILNKLPDEVRLRPSLIVVGDAMMPEKSDLDVDKMLVIPTKSVTNDTEIFLEGLGLHFSENQQAFEEAIEKDSCVAREEARQDTKKAFMYAAALYQNKWRAPFSKMLTHADRVGPYHEANLSCMYFQLRAVGKLVYHDEPKHLPSPSTLYPFRSRVEKFAGARQPATFSVERMPCVEIGGKISIKHSGARGADNEFSDPNKGKLTTGRGTIIKNGKKDDFDPQKPTCRYASVHGNNSRYYPHPWEKEFVFTANSVPEWGDYGNTYVSYEMTWKDKSKQVVNFNLYPPSACKES